MSGQFPEDRSLAAEDFALALRRLDTLFTRDAQGDLLTLNELEPVPPPTPAPCIYLGVTAGGVVRACRHDASAAVRAAIERFCTEPGLLAIGRDVVPGRLLDAIAHHAPRYAAWDVSAGPAYMFPVEMIVPAGVRLVSPGKEAVLAAEFPFTATWLRERWPCYAVVVDDRAVSIGYSARRAGGVAEAGVDTAPEFRGRGYAARVTAAWASAIRAAGITPVYSTNDDNHASRAVARKLGLREFCRDVSIDENVLR